MGKLLLLFVLVPAVELALLIQIGGMIGLLPTIAMIVLTGFVGATLARQQGLGVLRGIQEEMAQGQLPAQSLLDGVIILVAGAFLLTPGFLTDIVGLACLVPVTRGWIKRRIRRRLEGAVQTGQVTIINGGRWPGGQG